MKAYLPTSDLCIQIRFWFWALDDYDQLSYSSAIISSSAMQDDYKRAHTDWNIYWLFLILYGKFKYLLPFDILGVIAVPFFSCQLPLKKMSVGFGSGGKLLKWESSG